MKHFEDSRNLSQDPILLFTRTIYKKSLKNFQKNLKKSKILVHPATAYRG